MRSSSHLTQAASIVKHPLQILLAEAFRGIIGVFDAILDRS
jgi:hypothetical protein